MHAEPKLKGESPVHWIGGVTLMPEEVERIVMMLPNITLRTTLTETLQRARVLAEELNNVDRTGSPRPV